MSCLQFLSSVPSSVPLLAARRSPPSRSSLIVHRQSLAREAQPPQLRAEKIPDPPAFDGIREELEFVAKLNPGLPTPAMRMAYAPGDPDPMGTAPPKLYGLKQGKARVHRLLLEVPDAHFEAPGMSVRSLTPCVKACRSSFTERANRRMLSARATSGEQRDRDKA